MQYIICDLDGTLANIDHRLPLLENKNWDAFYAAIPDDTTNKWCRELLFIIEMSLPSHEILFVTGRPRKTEKDTRYWLKIHALNSHWQLFMRPDGDFRPDHIIKAEIYEQHLKDKDILFVLEDRQQVVDMWRKKGLVVLQCADGKY